MIEITMEGKQGRKIYLNPHQIEYLETDGERTSITLLSGKRYAVQEDEKVIVDRIVEYRRRIGISISE
ncbi:MAG: flagellar FlbD family protein [Spirochaetales bacterium]|nr:flagellar FlbD family protein [Spirochaetales bacterium]